MKRRPLLARPSFLIVGSIIMFALLLTAASIAVYEILRSIECASDCEDRVWRNLAFPAHCECLVAPAVWATPEELKGDSTDD